MNNQKKKTIPSIEFYDMIDNKYDEKKIFSVFVASQRKGNKISQGEIKLIRYHDTN